LHCKQMWVEAEQVTAELPLPWAAFKIVPESLLCRQRHKPEWVPVW